MRTARVARHEDPELKRLLNIRNEMSLAAGIPVPRLYVWATKVAVNSFTIGSSPIDSSIFISRGALQALTRDELQVLVAYGFSQILNGDCALNTRTAAYLGAMRWPTHFTRAMVFMPFEATDDKFRSFILWIFFALWVGLLLSVLTMPQYFAARWLQKRIGHERQRLNDATALQFTRDGYAYMNALIKASALNEKAIRMHPILNDVAQACFIGQPGRGQAVEHRSIFDRVRALQPSLTNEQISAMQREAREDFRHGLNESGRQVVARRKLLATASSVRELAAVVAVGEVALMMENDEARDEIARESPKRQEQFMATPHDAVAEYISSLESYDPRVVVFSLIVDRAPALRQAQIDYLRPHLGAQYTETLIRAIDGRKSLPSAKRIAALESSLARLRDLPPQELRSLRKLIRDLEQLDDYTDAFEYGTARMTEVYISDVLEARAPHGNRTLAHSASALQVALSVVAQFTDKQRAREAFKAGIKRMGMRRQLEFAPQLKWTAPLDRALKALEALMPHEKQMFLEGCRAIIDFDKVQSASERELLRVIAIQLHCPMPRLAQLEGVAA